MGSYLVILPTLLLCAFVANVVGNTEKPDDAKSPPQKDEKSTHEQHSTGQTAHSTKIPEHTTQHTSSQAPDHTHSTASNQGTEAAHSSQNPPHTEQHTSKEPAHGAPAKESTSDHGSHASGTPSHANQTARHKDEGREMTADEIEDTSLHQSNSSNSRWHRPSARDQRPKFRRYIDMLTNVPTVEQFIDRKWTRIIPVPQIGDAVCETNITRFIFENGTRIERRTKYDYSYDNVHWYRPSRLRINVSHPVHGTIFKFKFGPRKWMSPYRSKIFTNDTNVTAEDMEAWRENYRLNEKDPLFRPRANASATRDENSNGTLTHGKEVYKFVPVRNGTQRMAQGYGRYPRRYGGYRQFGQYYNDGRWPQRYYNDRRWDRAYDNRYNYDNPNYKYYGRRSDYQQYGAYDDRRYRPTALYDERRAYNYEDRRYDQQYYGDPYDARRYDQGYRDTYNDGRHDQRYSDAYATRRQDPRYGDTYDGARYDQRYGYEGTYDSRRHDQGYEDTYGGGRYDQRYADPYDGRRHDQAYGGAYDGRQRYEERKSYRQPQYTFNGSLQYGRTNRGEYSDRRSDYNAYHGSGTSYRDYQFKRGRGLEHGESFEEFKWKFAFLDRNKIPEDSRKQQRYFIQEYYDILAKCSKHLWKLHREIHTVLQDYESMKADGINPTVIPPVINGSMMLLSSLATRINYQMDGNITMEDLRTQPIDRTTYAKLMNNFDRMLDVLHDKKKPSEATNPKVDNLIKKLLNYKKDLYVLYGDVTHMVGVLRRTVRKYGYIKT